MIDFEPDRVTVRQLFEHSKKLEVPRYQRSYSWKEDNIDDFYNDFIKTSTDHLNFLGTLVFDASDPATYQLIDGQQRILTLTILYAVIRDILIEEIGTSEAERLATRIEDVFIKSGAQFSLDPTEVNSCFRVSPAKDVQEFFEWYVQLGGPQKRGKKLVKLNPSSKNIQRAYERLRLRIMGDKLSSAKDDHSKISLLMKVVAQTENINLIKIEIFNNEIAYAIFESHNAKGADLLISDLVKNYFFSQIKGPEEVRQKSMDLWDEIVESLRDQAGVKIDQFLHYYAQSYDGRFQKSQLYKYLKNEIKNNPSQFLKRLNSQSDLLIKLKDASVNDTAESRKLNLSLEGVAGFGIDQCYILLLSLFRNKDKFHPTHLRKIVELIENFTFLYTVIFKGPAHALERVYGDYARKIERELEVSEDTKSLEANGGRLWSSLVKEIYPLIPTYEQFEARFINLDYSLPAQKKVINYVFSKCEHFDSKGGTSLGIEISLDHVYPRSKGVGLKNVNKIGNLVPVDSKTNSLLGNKMPHEKVEALRQSSNIFAMRRLLKFMESNPTFNQESIDQRAKELADFAYRQVWAIKSRG